MYPWWYGPSGMVWGQFGPPPPQRTRRRALIVGLILAIVVVFIGSSAAIVALSSKGAPAALAIPTAVVTQGPTATPTETVIYQESFASKPIGWLENAYCFVGAGGYHVKGGFECPAPVTLVTDFTITAQVQQLSGSTSLPYGIAFRQISTEHYYEFAITSNGWWGLFRCGGGTYCSTIVTYTRSDALLTGLKKSNELKVQATGSHFDFFINGVEAGSAVDDSYRSGYMGFVGEKGIECVFTDLIVSQQVP